MASDWSANFHSFHPTGKNMDMVAQEIADGLQGGKGRGRGKPNGLACMTKAELLERAKTRKIVGRHAMSKDELIAARKK